MATQKLYDLHPYSTGFTAKIVDIYEDLRGDIFSFFYTIILDRTLFFPEAGGQTCDKGSFYINGTKYNVNHVSINKENEILHHISTSTPFVKTLIGKEVNAKIDWEHRFSNMQQHTGEHIISGLVHSMYGFNNVGFHLSDNIVTADFDGFLDEEAIKTIEKKANEAIYQNVSVTCYYPHSDLISSKHYRSKIDHGDEVRLVEIDGIDLCACCCPHVKSTGEIGLIKILSSIRYKGGSRVCFLSGKRALAYFNSLLKQSTELSQYLSAEKEALLPAVSALSTERDRLKQEISNLKARLLDKDIKEAMFLNNHPLVFTENYSMSEMRAAVNKLIEESGIYCGIFSGNDEEGYTFVLGSKNLDCNLVIKKLTEHFDAKGGGKREMIQGFVKGKEKDILKTILSLY